MEDFTWKYNLMEIQLVGRSFTWYRPDGTCKSKLDRMSVNHTWSQVWPNQLMKGGKRSLSDHVPIFIEEVVKDWGPKPFRFFNQWIQHPTFSEFVAEKWNWFNVQGWGGFRVKEKLKLLKCELKNWRVEVFGCLDAKIEEKKEQIEKLDLWDNVFGLEEVEKRRELMADLMQECSWREAQLFQKARIKWIKEGDANSCLFHNWINANNRRNGINGLWVGNSWVEEVAKVKEEIFKHFRNNFESLHVSIPDFDPSTFRCGLNDYENQFLESEFTEEEIRLAIWDCDMNGSPGPDDFSFGFYKECWNIIKHDVLAFISEFYQRGKIVKGLNPSFISLIPKKASPMTIDDFRPISLIRGVYKIIA